MQGVVFSFQAQMLGPCLMYQLSSGSLSCASAGGKVEPMVHQPYKAWAAWGYIKDTTSTLAVAQHGLTHRIYRISRAINRSSLFFAYCTHRSPAFCSKLLQHPVQLPVKWGIFSPGRVITCRDIRNGQISGSSNLVLKSSEVEMGNVIMLFRDSKSAEFSFFCPKYPALTIHCIKDIGGCIPSCTIHLWASNSWRCPIPS